VRLGRRLAPGVYRGVRPLIQTTDGWALGAAGETGAVHVVEMRRFDPRQTLAALVRDEAAVRAVARRIAALHADAEPPRRGASTPRRWPPP
jgi:aminoglycoside phosphotransferase family enzyme